MQAKPTSSPQRLKAPTFHARTIEGEPIVLEDFRGLKLWMAFYRHANCPFCHMRMMEVRDMRNELPEHKVRLIGVFQSPPERFEGTRAKEAAWYPLISDPDEILYRTYGLQSSLPAFLHVDNIAALKRAFDNHVLSMSFLKIDGTATRMPADFLIDEDGFIADSWYGKTISENIPLERVRAFVEGRPVKAPAGP